MFPAFNSTIYTNDEGEVLGWDTPSDDPPDPDEGWDDDGYDSEDDDWYGEGDEA